MTDKQRQDVFNALMGPIRKTGNRLLDRIADELAGATAHEVEDLEPVIDAMIQHERAERFGMLLEICEARCSPAAR